MYEVGRSGAAVGEDIWPVSPNRARGDRVPGCYLRNSGASVSACTHLILSVLLDLRPRAACQPGLSALPVPADQPQRLPESGQSRRATPYVQAETEGQRITIRSKARSSGADDRDCTLLVPDDRISLFRPAGTPASSRCLLLVSLHYSPSPLLALKSSSSSRSCPIREKGEASTGVTSLLYSHLYASGQSGRPAEYACMILTKQSYYRRPRPSVGHEHMCL